MDRLIDARLWLARLPWWVVLPSILVICTGFVWLFDRLNGTVLGPVWSVPYGLFVGGVAAFAFFWFRAREGASPEVQAQISKAQRTGRLPEDIDPAVWLKELRWREQRIDNRLVFRAVAYTIFAAIGLLVAINEGRWWIWGLWMLSAVLAIGQLVAGFINLPRIQDLQHTVREAYPLAESWPR